MRRYLTFRFIFPIVLIVLGVLVHFIYFGEPHSVVFDEVHNGKFISAYSTGSYYFDVHPPLGKLLSKYLGDIIGEDYNVNYDKIGNSLPIGIILLRLLPLIAGTLLPLIIYFMCRNLNMSGLSSFLAGALICLENSLIVQSRFILFDSLMLLFGFSAVLLYLLYRRYESKYESKPWLLIFSAVLASAAFSIKWTGLAFPLLIVISEIVRVKDVKKSLKFISKYAIIGLVFYMSIFAIHFSYLNKLGPGDAFMSSNFQSKSFLGKFMELNEEMLRANNSLTVHHDYSSSWYTWPLMIRPIFYWFNAPEGRYIYLLGNPIIYWLGFLSILLLILYSIKKRQLKGGSLFILIGFLVNFIPFIFIGRVMFLYHYEAALIFSIIAICFLIDFVKSRKLKIATVSGVFCICLVTFIYFSPLTYGLKLNNDQLMQRMWLKSWR